ncbi:MAG: NUDIX domain-containing protein [Candidatus Uhrbacteria bacterium]
MTAVVKEKSVGIVLFHVPSQRVLMLHSIGNAGWVFPKGHPHDHESDLQALLRELEEETGLTFNSHREHIQPLTIVRHQFMGREGLIKKDVMYYYLVLSGDLPEACVHDHDHDDLYWWPLAEATRIPYKYAADQTVLRALSEELRK